MRRGLAVYTQIFEVVGHLWDCLKKKNGNTEEQLKNQDFTIFHFYQ